jgi:putative nucleotidyltransferase-like protein
MSARKMWDTINCTPEMQLLLASARKTLRLADSERMVALCHGQLDWQIFLDLLDRHSVFPLVWHSLETCDDLPIPEPIRQSLHRQAQKHVQDALIQAADLIRLVQCFERAGIPVMPLKGPVLAMQAYGTLALRHVGDLDLLINLASVEDADRILVDAGYTRTTPGFTLSPGQTRAFKKIRKDFSYSHGTRAMHVELHWRWCQNAYLFPLSFEEIYASRVFVKLSSICITAMPREVLLLYLCAHGAHTGWFRLKWLCDLPALIDAGVGLDMAALMRQARDLGVLRVLSQGLLLAHHVLDMPLPPLISEIIRQDRIVRQGLVHIAKQALVQDTCYWTEHAPVSWMPVQLLYRLKLRANFRYKWHNIYFYSLWTEDWELVRLPERLLVLYFVLRPFLWIMRRLRKTFARPYFLTGH